MDAERILNIIILATVFGLVFSIWCSCVFLWLGRYFARLQRIQKRLGIVGREDDESKIMRLWRDTQHGEERVELAKSKRLTFQEQLRRITNDAGLHTPLQIVVLGVIGVAILAFVFTCILGMGALVGLGMSVIVMTVFWSYIRRRIAKRAALFERQLVDALGIAARSLRAGHPLVGAFQLISEEIGEPLGNVFYRICQEQAFGSNTRDSIRKVARATANPELKLFATAVGIQLQSGGNLADLMDSLASVIRARMRLNRKVRVLTAQTRLSETILIILPVLLFFVLNITSPSYMKPFYTTTAGRYMLVAAILSVLFGYWVMKRLSVLRF